MIARSRNAFEDRGERFRLVAQTIPSGKYFSESPLSGGDDDVGDDDDNCDDDGRIWQTHLRLRARNPSRRNRNGRAVMMKGDWWKC